MQIQGVYENKNEAILCFYLKGAYSPFNKEKIVKHQYFPQLHPLLHAVELYPGQVIYSLPQIYHSWTEL